MKMLLKNLPGSNLWGILLLMMSFLFPLSSMGQGTNVLFGKNRVQHQEFNWRYYRANEFDIYYYTGGKELARFIGRHASQYLEDAEAFLDYRAKDRMVFIIYNSYDDLQQSNIGYSTTNDKQNGVTPIVNNQAFLHFNGDHFELLKQARASITKVLVNEMLFGGNIQERVQNSTLLNLPPWYIKGLTEYIAEPITVEEREKLKNGVLSGKYRNFTQLHKNEKALVSKFIWRYVSKVYGKNSLSNIIYLNRVNKSLERGFMFVIGKDYNQVFEEWYRDTRRHFQEEERALSQNLKPHEAQKALDGVDHIKHVTLHPNESKIAYVTDELGKKQVWIYDFESESKDKIFKNGFKQDKYEFDDHYPLIEWQPTQKNLTLITEKKSTTIFMNYSLEEEKIIEERKNFRVNRVLDFSYNKRGKQMVLSGVKQGHSDIFLFNWRSNRMRRLTNDIYDDLHPAFSPNGDEIVFSSNRANSFIEKGSRWDLTGFNNNYDIFYYNYKTRSRDLKRLTFTNLVDEFHPDAYDTTYFSYLSHENGNVNRGASRLDSIFQYAQVVVEYEDTAAFGIDTFRFQAKTENELYYSTNRYKDTNIASIDTAFVYKDTAYTYNLTNRFHNIQDYQINQRRETITEFYKDAGQYKVTQHKIPENISTNEVTLEEKTFGTELKEMLEKREASPLVEPRFSGDQTTKEPSDTQETKKSGRGKDTGEIDIDNYYFQSEYENQEGENAANNKEEKGANGEEESQASSVEEQKQFERDKFGTARNYFLSFRPDYLQTKLDNSIINTKYLPFNQNNPKPYVYNPVMNAMVTMGISDFFQDYRIQGGFRLLGNLRGADYYMTYENLKDRLDKQISFFRRGEKNEREEDGAMVQETSHELRYSLKWPFSEKSSLRGDVFGRRDNEVTLSTEQNTLTEENNARAWTGLKLEYVYDNTMGRGINLRSGVRMKMYSEAFRSFSFQESQENTLFSVIGGDFRGYLNIFRDMIWANRFAFASSFGEAGVVYYMGGVDQWLFPEFNENVEIASDQNYVYKSLATNLRGFQQNIRNGNSYTVFNSELRIPIFKMFNRKPLMSNFFKSFQLIGFADVGTAWTGSDPFGESNALNRNEVERGNLNITVINLSNPFVGGYGFGLRTNLLGYFVRLDHAWGVEDQVVKNDGITYISVGMDF